MIQISSCTTEADYAKALDVTRAYTEWLGIDLGFQDIEGELANFDSVYCPPDGFYLLALDNDRVAGGVGLRFLGLEGDTRIAEMKRLFVIDSYQGQGVGKRLCTELMSRAGALGYGKIRLDTLPVMAAAHGLYQSLGFYEIEAYRHNPIEGTQYLECDLQQGRTT